MIKCHEDMSSRGILYFPSFPLYSNVPDHLHRYRLLSRNLPMAVGGFPINRVPIKGKHLLLTKLFPVWFTPAAAAERDPSFCPNRCRTVWSFQILFWPLDLEYTSNVYRISYSRAFSFSAIGWWAKVRRPPGLKSDLSSIFHSLIDSAGLQQGSMGHTPSPVSSPLVYLLLRYSMGVIPTRAELLG